MWHHLIHEEWGKERLYFWRLGFKPTYNRDEILDNLGKVFGDHRVLSYSIYESTGESDLFVRLWLPTTTSQRDFEKSLVDNLKELKLCDPFVVSDIIDHWVWMNSSFKDMRVPSEQVLNRPLQNSEIEKINNYSISLEGFNKYAEMNLIAPWSPKKGIRLIIIIPRSPNSLPVDAHQQLTVELRNIIYEEEILSDISIYAGEGFAQFLIIATIDSKDFLRINEVIKAINSIGLQSFFEVRTYTHVIVSSAGRGLPLEDKIPESTVIEETKIEAYLSGKETQTIEIKGSAFTDMKKLIIGDGKIKRSEVVTNDGVLKSIVGFLNAEGGKVIIGALESKDFPTSKNDKVSKRTKNFPKYGEYIICGINVDYGDQDSDLFLRQLQSVIRKKIRPLSTKWLDLNVEEFQGRELCVVNVHNVLSNDWYYLVVEKIHKFYVREGNSTVILNGVEADEYRRTHPR